MDVPTIAFAVWLTFLGRAGGHSILHVDLTIDRGTTSARMVNRALREAAAIWASYGVDVRAAGCSSEAAAHSIPLHVAVLPHHPSDTQEGSIGSIAFAVDTPLPNVSLYVDDVDALVVATLGEEVHAWPAARRDEVEGRALGRALAHEIGHYLLRTRQHARSGLMRAHQPVPFLIAVERRRFSLSRGEIVRLAVLHASAMEPSNRVTTVVTGDRNSSQSNSSSITSSTVLPTIYR